MTPTDFTMAVTRQVIHAIQGPTDTPARDEQPLFYAADKEGRALHFAAGGAGLDSLDRVEAVMLLEEQFGIDIPDRDLDSDEAKARFNTITGIAGYVQGKLAEKE